MRVKVQDIVGTMNSVLGPGAPPCDESSVQRYIEQIAKEAHEQKARADVACARLRAVMAAAGGIDG